MSKATAIEFRHPSEEGNYPTLLNCLRSTTPIPDEAGNLGTYPDENHRRKAIFTRFRLMTEKDGSEDMPVQAPVARITRGVPELTLSDMTLRRAQMADKTLDRELSLEVCDATGASIMQWSGRH